MDHTFNFTLSGFAYPRSVFILAKSTSRISDPSVHGINPSERCSSPGFYTPFEASGSLTVFSATQPRGSKCRMQLQSFAPLAKRQIVHWVLAKPTIRCSLGLQHL